MARTELFDPRGWTKPQFLLAALLVAVLATTAVGATTSGADFGVYNPGWDGVSGVQDVSATVGTPSTVALETATYTDVEPNGTVALVLAPDRTYDDAEGERLARFVRSGGTLVVAEDFGPAGDSVLAAVGADARFDGRPLRDERRFYRAPGLPIAPNVTMAPATTGVEGITLNHGTAVTANRSAADTAVLVRSSPFSYLDTDRDQTLSEEERLGGRPVVVRERIGDGTVYVVSDPSAFINAMLDRDGNRRLLSNLLSDHDRALIDVSHRSNQPPASVALVALRANHWVQAAIALAVVVGIGVGVRVPAAVTRAVRHSGRRRSARSSDTDAVDRESLVAYLERRHPDWDTRRIRRVIGGVLTRGEQRRDNE